MPADGRVAVSLILPLSMIATRSLLIIESITAKGQPPAASRLLPLPPTRRVDIVNTDIVTTTATAYSVLVNQGLPGDQASRLAPRLRGESREELEADAVVLLEALGLPVVAPTSGHPDRDYVPATDPHQGCTGGVREWNPLADGLRQLLATRAHSAR